MPIYEYECSKCGEVTERLQGISDPPLRKCPSCGAKVKKQMSPGAFVLKGTGWYATDYAGKGNGKEPPKAASCPAAAEKSDLGACAGCPKAK